MDYLEALYRDVLFDRLSLGCEGAAQAIREVLNFVNRHAALADPLHAFLQNLTVAMTGTTHGAAVISLPRSQVEMTERDMQWQSRITKVVRRVAKDLIANDETEISEVIRRRLFEELGNERTRKGVAKSYADWCFERRAQLPPVHRSRHRNHGNEGRSRFKDSSDRAGCYERAWWGRPTLPARTPSRFGF